MAGRANKNDPLPGEAGRRLLGWLAWGLALLLLSSAFAEALYRRKLERETPRRPGVFELYSVGESSMDGAPFYHSRRSSASPPHMVSLLFGEKLAGRPVREISLSAGGNSSYPQSLKFRRAVKYRDRSNPGALLIYLGHNEQLSVARPAFPHRAYSWLRDRVLDRSFVLGELAFRAERALGYRGGRGLAHYEYRLRSIVESALDAGLVPVIATLAGNISAFEPATGEKRGEFDGAFAPELAGYPAAAERRYRELLGRRPGRAGVAYLAYRRARCLEKQGRGDGALFLEALEKDPAQLRARPSQNALIRRLAAEYGLVLADVEAGFRLRSRRLLPGDDLFVDHVHPDQEGYLLLAGLLAEGLGRALGETPKPAGAAAGVYAPPGQTARDRALPYYLAGTYMLWFAFEEAPIPDRLALAEKNYRRALALCPGHDLAALCLRAVRLCRRSGERLTPELGRWFRGLRPLLEQAGPLSEKDRAELDSFLLSLERRRPG